jgi:hypothetical protein
MIDKNELLKLLPKLIREDDEVKGAIISALSGVVATKEDIKLLIDNFNQRFKDLEEANNKRFEEINKRFERVDKRFERVDKQFERVDKRFERVDKQFERVDKRFERVDKRFDIMDENFREIKDLLGNIQQTLGKPFEQFGRNIISRLLQSEGLEDIKLESKKIHDENCFVSEGSKIVEIDGFSLEPSIIVEITSILRDIKKVEKFLKKKLFVENKFKKKFRGFLVAAATEFDAEEIGQITIKLRENNCELINL